MRRVLWCPAHHDGAHRPSRTALALGPVVVPLTGWRCACGRKGVRR